MKVYRVEYPDGIGPYHPPDNPERWPGRMALSFDLTDAHSYGRGGHPVAQIPYGMGYRCAFRSMRDLFRWFGGWLPLILKLGAKVKTYDVPSDGIVYEDSHQVAFAPCLAMEVGK